MYPVSASFLAALRGPHTLYARVDAYHGGRMLAANLPFSAGAVDIGSGDGVRRTLSLTVTDVGLWDALPPMGVELHAYRGITDPAGQHEVVPLGVFDLDQMSRAVVAPAGIEITAPDRWARVARARFETPRVSDYQTNAVNQIATLVREAVPCAVAITATSPLMPGALVWDRDRAAAITDLATAARCEVFFDHAGSLRIIDLPVASPVPVWTVDTGPAGVMLSATASRDRARVYNVVVVSTTSTDGTGVYPPQIAADTDPLSPTYVGGPFGRVPYFIQSAVIGDRATALAAAKAWLPKVSGRFTTITAEGVVNPALDRGDTIGVTTVNGNVEPFLLDAVSVPLTADGTQTYTTRSPVTVPDSA